MKKHTVYISGHLPNDESNKGNYGEEVYNQLHTINEIEVKEIQHHSDNVWCRDYMPVKSAIGNYVQFTYYPSYMREMKKYKDKFPEVKKIHHDLKLECIPSKIVLDGGAIEIQGKKGIVSDRVFRDNSDKTPTEIYKELKKVLELDQLVVIPQYPYDFTGHVDGLVRFINEKSVVVNDLKKELDRGNTYKNHDRRKVIESWVYAFKSALVSAGLKLEELPDSVPEKGSPNSGEGIYTNFLALPDLILMPAYGSDTDDLAAKKLNDLFKRKVIQVNAKELSQMGGMINCVTWTR
jgi:agmatine deiminase